MFAFLRRLFGRASAPVFLRSWRPLSADEQARALAGWGPQDLRFRAMWDFLAAEIEMEMEQLAAQRADPSAILQSHGRFQAYFLIRRQMYASSQVPKVGD